MWRRATAFAFHFTPFATEVFDETEPSWSPDGQTIIYTGTARGMKAVKDEAHEEIYETEKFSNNAQWKTVKKTINVRFRR